MIASVPSQRQLLRQCLCCAALGGLILAHGSCSDDSSGAGGDSGIEQDGAPGSDAALPACETSVTITPEQGGTICSEDRILEISFQPKTVTEPTTVSISTVTDSGLTDFWGQTYEIGPANTYLNTGARATWRLPASVVSEWFAADATPPAMPLPVAYVAEATWNTEPLSVSEYRNDQGSIVMKTNVNRMGVAYISKLHSVATFDGVSVVGSKGQATEVPFAIQPGDSGIVWSGSGGSYEDAGPFDVSGVSVETDGADGLSGAFRARCERTGPGRAEFEINGKAKLERFEVGYSIWFSFSYACEN